MRLLPLAVLPVLLFVFASCGDDDNNGTTAAPTATAAEAATQTTAPTTASTAPVAIGLEKLPGAYSRPTFVTNAGDGANRLFVLEKPGRVRVLREGSLVTQPFLDITSLVRSTGNEQGLLGLAFHPDFESNGRFFVAYTALDSKNTVAEYRVSTSGSDSADASSAKILLAVADQYANHNGGMLAFGPDGYLYISMGDGGSGGDPHGNGQNRDSLLGKLLRIDVNSGNPYGIPSSNPFANDANARKEVWAYGLRNAWRFTFDRETGDVWIADVGQNKFEELDFQPAGSKGGENYGWNIMEGNACYKPASGCNQEGLVKPFFEYGHGEGCSVTGGYVYRGAAIGALVGRYIFTDYCTPTLWLTTRSAGGEFTTIESGELPGGVSAFGEDESGELYITVDGEGAVYKLVAN